MHLTKFYNTDPPILGGLRVILSESKFINMKKLNSLIVLVFALSLIAPTYSTAQNFSDLDVSPLDVASYPSSYRQPEKKVKVYYSRPQLKNRALSNLAPNDKVWRTGANESAEITFYEDMKVGGNPVKAGTYSLYTIPGDKEWTVILNSDLNTWGAYSYNEGNDVVRVKVPVTQGDKSLEAFSIAFDDDMTMHMGWDKARIAVPITK